MDHMPLFYKNNQMTRSTKLFFATVVLALSLSGLQAAGAEIFNELHDLKRTNEQLAQEISEYLNSIVANMVKTETPLDKLLGNFAYYRTTIKKTKLVYNSEEEVVEAVNELFKRETSNIINGDASNLQAECNKIFHNYAIFVYANNIDISNSEFFAKSKVLEAIVKQIKLIFDEFNKSLGKNSKITTTVTEKVQANLKVSTEYKNRLSDYIKFKENPIEVLINASTKLVDGTNEKPAEFESLFDPLNDRVFEYVKATALIGKKRDQPWVPQVLKLVDKLIEHTKTKNPAYDWNVKLIHRILGLLKENGHQPAAMEIIQEFLKESEPTIEEEVVPVKPVVIEEPTINHPSKIHQDDGVQENVDIEEEKSIIDEPVEEEPIQEPVEEEEPVQEHVEEEEEPQVNDVVIPKQENLNESRIHIEIPNDEIKEIPENLDTEEKKTPFEVVEPIIEENKIDVEGRAENLVNVVVGELTPKQLDIMRFSPDVVGVIQEKKIEIDENGDEVEYVYVSIIRSDSPCYEDAIQQMSE